MVEVLAKANFAGAMMAEMPLAKGGELPVMAKPFDMRAGDERQVFRRPKFSDNPLRTRATGTGQTHLTRARRTRPKLDRRLLLRMADNARLLGLFLRVDDDPRGDHDEQALRLAAEADVLEQAVDVGHLAEHRRAELVAAFAERL